MSGSVERFADQRPPSGTGPSGRSCRGCEVPLPHGAEPWCASCLGPVAVVCACGESWTLDRVPEIWPVCPKCRRREFVASTATAAIAVVEA